MKSHLLILAKFYFLLKHTHTTHWHYKAILPSSMNHMNQKNTPYICRNQNHEWRNAFLSLSLTRVNNTKEYNRVQEPIAGNRKMLIEGKGQSLKDLYHTSARGTSPNCYFSSSLIKCKTLRYTEYPMVKENLLGIFKIPKLLSSLVVTKYGYKLENARLWMNQEAEHQIRTEKFKKCVAYAINV